MRGSENGDPSTESKAQQGAAESRLRCRIARPTGGLTGSQFRIGDPRVPFSKTGWGTPLPRRELPRDRRCDSKAGT
jgi:hypothetical protein